MDIRMAEMNGMEAMRAIRKRGGYIPGTMPRIIRGLVEDGLKAKRKHAILAVFG